MSQWAPGVPCLAMVCYISLLFLLLVPKNIFPAALTEGHCTATYPAYHARCCATPLCGISECGVHPPTHCTPHMCRHHNDPLIPTHMRMAGGLPAINVFPPEELPGIGVEGKGQLGEALLSQLLVEGAEPPLVA